jgi:tetratricopeptide (TPR) repeat protein
MVRTALEHDPDFVPARIRLAAVIAEDDTRRDQVAPELQRAMSSASRGTDLDRAMAAAAFHSWQSTRTRMLEVATLREHNRQQVAACRSLQRMRPRDEWALLCVLNSMARQGDEPVEALEQWLQLMPHSLQAHRRAVILALRSGDIVAVERAYQRAMRLDAPLNAQTAGDLLQLRFTTVAIAWLQSLPQDAVQRLRTLLADLEAQPIEIRSHLAWYGVYAHLTLGRLKDAEALLAHVDRPINRLLLQTWLGTQAENRDGLRLTLARRASLAATERRAAPSPSEWLESGSLADARAAAAKVAIGSPQFNRVHGEVALAEGRVDEALTLLQEALRTERNGYTRPRLARYIADGLVRKQRLPAAIAGLEAVTSEPRSRTLSNSMMGFTWLAARSQLAELYRMNGRTAAADAVDRELATLLSVADDDHPIRQRLARGGFLPLPAQAPRPSR